MSAEEGDIPSYISDEEDEAVVDGGEKAAGGDKGHIGVTANFKEFLLKAEIAKAISDVRFEHPSKVQEEAIPEAIAGNDIIAQAKSGMGKTAVYVIVTLDRVDVDKGLNAIVICPTKELVTQVVYEFQRFSVHLPQIRTVPIFGGVDERQQIKELKENPPHIIVACPGRLNKLVLSKDKVIDCSNLKIFVLDEVDKVLEDDVMRQQVQEVFYRTPKNKQTMLFSATLAPEMKKVVTRFVRNPKMILLEAEKLVLHGLKQYYVKLKEEEKTRKLVDLLDVLEFNQVVIFCSRTDRAVKLSEILNTNGFPAMCLVGKMQTEKRIDAYTAFKKYEKRILVSTDLCARGIDIDQVNIVFNYDFPSKRKDEADIIPADTYLHRVGRAGRFGNRGLAVSFVSSPEDEKIFELVQSRFSVQVDELPEEIDVSSYLPRAGVREQFDE